MHPLGPLAQRLELSQPGMTLVHGTWSAGPGDLAWQVAASAVEAGQPLLVQLFTAGLAGRLGRLVQDAASQSIPEQVLSQRLSSAQIEPVQRPELVAALAAQAVSGGVIFIPHWDRLADLGLNTPKTIAALAALAGHTRTHILICAGYLRRQALFAPPRMRTAWVRHAPQRLSMYVVPGGHPECVSYTQVGRGHTKVTGRLWRAQGGPWFQAPGRGAVRPVPVAGHDGKVVSLRFDA